MAAIVVETGNGPPPAKRYEDNMHEYMRGYALGVRYRYAVTTAEMHKQASRPIRDSHDEGFQDGLQGKVSKYES